MNLQQRIDETITKFEREAWRDAPHDTTVVAYRFALENRGAGPRRCVLVTIAEGMTFEVPLEEDEVIPELLGRPMH